MNQRQERTYIKPLTTLVDVIENECIMAASGTTAEGGHVSAGDDETLHAKGFNFFSDEEDNYTSETTEKRK